MGKSAKFMRVNSHEKQKRVKKGGEWKESGLKIARKEWKRDVRDKPSDAELLFGKPQDEEKYEKMLKQKKNPFGGLANELLASYRSGGKKNAVTEGGEAPQKVKTGKQKKVEATQKKKVKVSVGKIKLRNNA